MSYGKIEYNQQGKVKCEICDRYFDRPLNHVHQAHDMHEKEYKRLFGFDVKKGICSKQSAQKSREAVYDHYDTAIAQNLLKNGVATRFKDGSAGRVKAQVSEQTRLRLSKNVINFKR